MLAIPLLKPGQQPYSPQLQLALGQPPAPPRTNAPADPTPELTLDHSIVKDCLTTLHQQIDRHFGILEQQSGADIASIPADLDKFLAEQINSHKNALASAQRQHLFDEMTHPLFDQARQRAQALYLRKVDRYQSETIDRQNNELVIRALADENIFNDLIQTQYRDLILFNLETALRRLPEQERREKLDAAGAALYRRIMDKRLELDPRRLEPILSSPAVRRVLGEDEAREYDRKVDAALKDLALRETGRKWIDAGVDPEEAKKKAGELGEDENAALTHYRDLRAADSEKFALAHILDAQSAWAALREGSYRREALPAWAARNRPELYATLTRLLEAWLGNGGVAPEPDCLRFLDHMANADRGKMWEELREEKDACEFIEKLGGVSGWAFDIASRKILAKTTDEDKALVRDLTAAREAFVQANEDARPETINCFLADFRRNRQRKLERLGVKELLTTEVGELIAACAASA